MEGSQTGAAASSPREVVAFLLSLRPVLAHATEVRRAWIRDVGLLIEEARTGDPIALARTAGKLGHGQVPAFRESRLQVSHLLPPSDCFDLHEAVLGWLDKQIQACESLIHAEQMRSLRPLRDLQEQLGEGRHYSQKFNEEYARLVADLRQRVDAALERRRGRGQRGLFGRRSRRRSGSWWLLLGRLPRQR